MIHHIKQLTKKAQRGAVAVEFVPLMGIWIGVVVMAVILIVFK